MSLTWEGRPAERSPYDSVRLRAFVILGGVGVAFLLSLFASIYVLTGRDDDTPVETYTPPIGAGVAATVMDAWVRGQKLAVPVAPLNMNNTAIEVISKGSLSGVRWWEAGVDVTGYLAPNNEFVPLELHRFTMLIGGNDENAPRLYTVTVPVSIQRGNIPVPVGPPTVGPYVGQPQEIVPSRWSDVYSDTTLSERATNRVKEWVAAYLADDREALANIAGVQSGDYAGIRGFTLSGEVLFLETVQPTGDNHYLTRIAIPVTSQEDFETALYMELIVIDDGQTAPRVVSWGTVGEGLELLNDLLYGPQDPSEGENAAGAGETEDTAPAQS